MTQTDYIHSMKIGKIKKDVKSFRDNQRKNGNPIMKKHYKVTINI